MYQAIASIGGNPVTVYLLPEEPIFPPAEEADPDGLIAIGGDLSVQRLIQAYSSGIFPWFIEDKKVYWFSPDPRLIMLPGNYRRSESLKRILKQGKFSVSIDTCFEQVIRACGETPRPGDPGTWINDDFIQAYNDLYRLGLAHSFEAFEGDRLVGGLYGVSLGAAFFGESMFFERPNASKIAYSALVDFAVVNNLHFIDCQVVTDHLVRAGALSIPRPKYLEMVGKALEIPTIQGRWKF